MLLYIESATNRSKQMNTTDKISANVQPNPPRYFVAARKSPDRFSGGCDYVVMDRWMGCHIGVSSWLREYAEKVCAEKNSTS
jgi:hypothetical protein